MHDLATVLRVAMRVTMAEPRLKSETYMRAIAGQYRMTIHLSARRSSQFSGKARAGIPHYPLPTKDVRPIRDRHFQARMARTVFEYLQDAQCPVTNLSLKNLQSPTLKDFQAIFRFLIIRNDPQYQFGKANKKFEDEFLMLLKDLRYPHADQITKTHLAAANSQHSWPTILAVLYWIVEWTKACFIHHSYICSLDLQTNPLSLKRNGCLTIPQMIHLSRQYQNYNWTPTTSI
jgi:SMC interacting uncharacterized protein involved in chromosome segregation